MREGKRGNPYNLCYIQISPLSCDWEHADDVGGSPAALDAEEASALAGLPAEEAVAKLQSQNRALRAKLRAAYAAEEENTKLRSQVEQQAQQLVRDQRTPPTVLRNNVTRCCQYNCCQYTLRDGSTSCLI